MTLSQTRKQGSDIKFINEEGDIYLTNVYTETINGVLVKDNLYIYVDATLGSDTTGDGTSALPFKTIQKGFDKMVEYVSPNIKWLIIRDGTYNENIEVPQTLVGSIYLVGDIADASNVVVQGVNVNSPVFRVNCTGTIYFNGLTIQGATASHGILCENSQCFILYSNFFNNRTGVFSYNSGNVYFAGPGLPYPDSVIDGNNISGSYGLKSEFDSVISSSQDLTIQNVDYGISCKYSSASLMGTYNITAKYSAILAKDNSYLAFGLGTYNLTGSSNALTTVRGVVVEESQIDLSQVTINFDTFYYGFYGLTGCKIAEAESITQHYNYTDVTKPAYIEYDSVISSTTDLDTTIEYFESAVAFGLDKKYEKGGLKTVADHTERNAIDNDLCEEGMLVYTESDGITWQLKAGFSNPTVDGDWINSALLTWTVGETYTGVPYISPSENIFKSPNLVLIGGVEGLSGGSDITRGHKITLDKDNCLIERANGIIYTTDSTILKIKALNRSSCHSLIYFEMPYHTGNFLNGVWIIDAGLSLAIKVGPVGGSFENKIIIYPDSIKDSIELNSNGITLGANLYVEENIYIEKKISLHAQATGFVTASGIDLSLITQRPVLKMSCTGNTTITATPSIQNGTHGQTIILKMDSGFGTTLTFQDESVLPGSGLKLGGANISMQEGDILVLYYDITDGIWYKISHSDN